MLGSLIIASTIATFAGGCVIRGNAHARFIAPAPVVVMEVDEEPPPPRVDTWSPRAGFVWVDGRWFRQGGRWEWRAGYYERERANHVWVQGHWDRRGNRHVWVDGRWNAGASVQPAGPTVRDHRREPQPEPTGPTVRDHRH
ncbi:MAG: YXWGXW repeat-containing protein [Proteobacteria bacterium]|nr:YXWGXW repeat-containing protein [Pseudomonadota bacterium]